MKKSWPMLNIWQTPYGNVLIPDEMMPEVDAIPRSLGGRVHDARTSAYKHFNAKMTAIAADAFMRSVPPAGHA